MGSLSPEETAVVSMGLRAGNSTTDIARFNNLKLDAVIAAARELDLEPTDRTQRRAKELFGSSDANSYQQIAEALRAENLKNDGKAVHYLTVATWARSLGWRWGGSSDGVYVPPRPGAGASRSKYRLRVSKATAAEMNSAANIKKAVAAAWAELTNDGTDVVQLAAIRGAAAAGVTNVDAVRKGLLAKHGDAIRSAKS